MANQHDTQDQGGGFWGCANIFMALGFAACAGIAGGALIIGGMSKKTKEAKTEPAAGAAPVVAAPAAAAPTAPGPAPAPGGATPAPPAPAGGTVEVTIKPSPGNALMYDTTQINARSGQKVRITYVNQHPTTPMLHNLLICQPGSKDRIIGAANAMTSDLPKWQAKDFIPETPDVLHHTKLINPNETVVLEFTAGPAGDYPYLCTFPGHSLIMQGTLKVQ